ncbi:universal stress protein, partial [Enterobacter asburiae]
QNDVTLKMPAFEWVHVQLHQQKGMISLSPPTICNSALCRYAADNGVDLIVMGAYGHSSLRRFFIGSNTTAMLEQTRVPLLMLR